MAAITAGTEVFDIWGQKRVWTANLTAVANGETLVIPLGRIDHAWFTPTTAGGGTQIGMTWSGSTLTFALEGAALAGTLTAIGS